jgi:hypothetical protein
MKRGAALTVLPFVYDHHELLSLYILTLTACGVFYLIYALRRHFLIGSAKESFKY